MVVAAVGRVVSGGVPHRLRRCLLLMEVAAAVARETTQPVVMGVRAVVMLV